MMSLSIVNLDTAKNIYVGHTQELSSRDPVQNILQTLIPTLQSSELSRWLGVDSH